MLHLKPFKDRVIFVLQQSSAMTKSRTASLHRPLIACQQQRATFYTKNNHPVVLPTQGLVTISERPFSSRSNSGGGQKKPAGQLNNCTHLSSVVQQEVFRNLTLLEFDIPHLRLDINMKAVKDQYLKLAQKYHPDRSSSGSGKEDKAFIDAKAAYDRVVAMDRDFKGGLFVSPTQFKKM